MKRSSSAVQTAQCQQGGRNKPFSRRRRRRRPASERATCPTATGAPSRTKRRDASISYTRLPRSKMTLFCGFSVQTFLAKAKGGVKKVFAAISDALHIAPLEANVNIKPSQHQNWRTLPDVPLNATPSRNSAVGGRIGGPRTRERPAVLKCAFNVTARPRRTMDDNPCNF